jgi:predicted O-linked N-acetylglucosamine transferase (SPINDLY family)
MTDNDAVLLTSLLRDGKLNEAEAVARRCLTEGRHADLALFALGFLFYQRQDFDQAVDALQRSIALNPTPAAWTNLGAAYRATARLTEAAAAYESALALDSKFSDAAANFANVLVDLGNHDAAHAMAARAIADGADTLQVYITLGNAQFRQGDLLAAATSFSKALERGYNAGAVRNLGSTLANLGRFTDAKRVYGTALARAPNPELHSSFLICLTYDPDMSAADLRAASGTYDSTYAKPFASRAVKHTNTPKPDRPLKIGYVSPDLCNHVVAVFMLPLMARHDRSVFDITCYADVRHVDETSRKFQAISKWVQITGLSDDRVANLIQEDEIDVLIDLAGHSPGNRQLVFARKPAPVQLSYVIGTGTTTGLKAMDGLIADDILLPPGVEQHISERPVPLGRPFVAYEPPRTMPAVGSLPALRNGYVTFGYFGRPIRLNDHVVRVWSEILHACPGSRLRLDNKPFGAASTQEDVRRRFLAHGIGSERLDLLDTPNHAAVLAAYNEIDIALDPFPHNAGTTSLEALWMGAPVLTLVDRPPVGRLGASLLGALDLRDWITETDADYIAKAKQAAADLQGLAAIRSGLRVRCEQSQLRDIDGLTRAMEHAYRKAWQNWCAAQNGQISNEPPT